MRRMWSQEAMLRAFKFFDGFRGADARSWVLKIVRNTCFTWLQANRPNEIVGTVPNELDELPDVTAAAVLFRVGR